MKIFKIGLLICFISFLSANVLANTPSIQEQKNLVISNNFSGLFHPDDVLSFTIRANNEVLPQLPQFFQLAPSEIINSSVIESPKEANLLITLRGAWLYLSIHKIGNIIHVHKEDSAANYEGDHINFYYSNGNLKFCSDLIYRNTGGRCV